MQEKGISFVAFCENSGFLRARSWWFHLPLGEKSELLAGENYISFVTASTPSGEHTKVVSCEEKKGKKTDYFVSMHMIHSHTHKAA